MVEVHTPRLRLVALPLDGMRLLAWQGQDALENHFGWTRSGLRVPAAFHDDWPQAQRIQLQGVEAHAEAYPWYTGWQILLRDENRAIGSTGFAGPPDEAGRVFTGYWIDDRFQRKGYMTEALGGLVGWVLSQPGVRSVGASTPLGHDASQRVLLKNGFSREGDYEGHPLFVLWLERAAAGAAGKGRS
jgi:RimJ/RimL family protein N-acetyltransferase